MEEATLSLFHQFCVVPVESHLYWNFVNPEADYPQILAAVLHIRKIVFTKTGIPSYVHDHFMGILENTLTRLYRLGTSVYGLMKFHCINL